MKKIIFSLSGILLAMISFGQTGQGVRQWTLEECINYGWENNLTIRSSELNLLTNELGLKESKFALLPNLNAGGQLGKSFGRTIDPVTNRFISSDFLSGGISANSSLALSRGGILRNSIKRNEVNLQASEYDLQKGKNDIGLSIATNFLSVLLNKEQLGNARFQLQVTEDQLARTIILVDAGSLPISNRLDLDSQKASNEVNVVNAENALNISILNLKQSMQMPADDLLDIVAPEIEVGDVGMRAQSPAQIFQSALLVQPDIKSVDLAVESSELGVKIAKGSFYPSLSLNGSVSSNYSDRATDIIGSQDIVIPPSPIGTVQETGQNVFSLGSTVTVPITSDDYNAGSQLADNIGQSVSININIPIFARFGNSANLQRAQISKQRSEITAMNTRNQLRQNIESAYNNAVASLKSYEATEKRVEALEESFRSTEERYNAGGEDFVDYQISSNNLFAARTDLVQSKYEYVFRVKILDFYLGNPITLN